MDKKKLKSQSHKLKPVVIIGQHGLTESVQQEIDQALEAHELIKIRVNAESKEARKEMADQICEHQKADLINQIGHIITIYRQSEDD
jgi:RNA-binding protein